MLYVTWHTHLAVEGQNFFLEWNPSHFLEWLLIQDLTCVYTHWHLLIPKGRSWRDNKLRKIVALLTQRKQIPALKVRIQQCRYLLCIDFAKWLSSNWKLKIRHMYDQETNIDTVLFLHWFWPCLYQCSVTVLVCFQIAVYCHTLVRTERMRCRQMDNQQNWYEFSAILSTFLFTSTSYLI